MNAAEIIKAREDALREGEAAGTKAGLKGLKSRRAAGQ